ncbi:MAG: Gfo/Idh/MocA family oxidoreductase [Aquincola sp.]|nr:Gfo/Idh/MocA family oxidoreductase [Aquincola sp.]
MTTSQPVRWGILSTAGIALRRVIPVLQQNPALMEVRAIASRQQAAAEGAAQAHGIALAYGSYAALLADPDIDAIYNPLPNHLHVPLTLAALQAGKHVLCEKPFAMNAAELAALRPYATQLHIREAFMVRHHPQWAAVRRELRAGALGTLRFMQVPFGYFNTDAANIRNRPEAGGGALYDIGCYAAAAARWCFEREPLRVACSIDRDADFGTDRLCSALLDFGAEGQMVFSVSTQAHRYQRLHLVGTQGRLEMEMPFNAPQGAASRYWVEDAAGLRTIDLPPADQYLLQMESFSRAVREEAPTAAGLDEAEAGMRVIDALFASAASGRFEAVAG